MKKTLALILALTMIFALAACGAKTEQPAPAEEPQAEETEPVELVVFAAASLTETLTEITENYKAVAPNVTILCNFASSGKLLTQITEGADCDLFISAAPKQINALDGALKDDAEKNPDGLDRIVQGSRINLLQNKVVLAVPDGNPAGIETFDQLAERLRDGSVFLAIGNADVPVGQYTQKIFQYYDLDEEALAAAQVLTYGDDVKVVTSAVKENAADCGIIYATDAFSANLQIADEATAEMCGEIIYPAAVLQGEKEEAAQAFLDYLCSDDAASVFAGVGFTPLA